MEKSSLNGQASSRTFWLAFQVDLKVEGEHGSCMMRA